MLEIWNPVVKDEDLHPNFTALMQPYHTPTREVIKRWTKGFVDRDNKIVKEFQTTFNSSFWEFYLNAIFKELNFNINFSYDRPDFILTKNGIDIAAEAVVTSHPDGAKPEWLKDFSELLNPEIFYEIIQLATIRLCNSIMEKHKRYCNSYNKLTYVQGKPFVICIAPFEQAFFYSQSDNAIRRVLYKYNAPIYVKSGNNIRVIGNEYTNAVTKHNDATIELGLFTDDRMKEVSAVLFSSTATTTKAMALNSRLYPKTMFTAIRYRRDSWDIPYFINEIGAKYSETLLDGLHLFLNPYAEYPLDPNLFYSSDIVLHQYDTEAKMQITLSEDKTLISRSCITFKVKNTDEIAPRTEGATTLFEKKVKSFEEDKLYKIDATVGFGVDNYISHHDGWTIVVFRDVIDNEWAAIAKDKKFFFIQEFINFQTDNDIFCGFYRDRESAYDAVLEKLKKK